MLGPERHHGTILVADDNEEVLLRKQQPWHQALVKQIERVMAPGMMVKV